MVNNLEILTGYKDFTKIIIKTKRESFFYQIYRRLFPLNGCRWFRTDIINNPVYAPHLVNDFI